MHWRALSRTSGQIRYDRLWLWLRLVAIAVLIASMTGWLAGCESIADWFRDALPRTGRDVG